MTAAEKRKIQRALNALRKQRVILKESLRRIEALLCRLPIGSRERFELLAIRDSIVEALRLNAIAIRNLKEVSCAC
ncbi:hypothetical protein [Paenibacillus odorifer]|uniref:Uncharacterized protein n=1 Tax=Paenibacillus odorifer TaxID=189426 RepID=A0A1R0Y4M9_9BACL|nr:hypothetical protein [Paenibacillus odorifer]OMD42201.1 hypothetical protein BSK52_08880 [Paenibacillus odorifer]